MFQSFLFNWTYSKPPYINHFNTDKIGKTNLARNPLQDVKHPPVASALWLDANILRQLLNVGKNRRSVGALKTLGADDDGRTLGGGQSLEERVAAVGQLRNQKIKIVSAFNWRCKQNICFFLNSKNFHYKNLKVLLNYLEK